MVSETIGQRFRRLREARHLTRDQLAQRSGVGSSTLAAIELDRTDTPQRSTLFAVARVLGTTPDYLLTGEEPEPSDLDKMTFEEFLRSDRLPVKNPQIREYIYSLNQMLIEVDRLMETDDGVENGA